MKNIILYTLVLILFFSATGCTSGHYVATRPAPGMYSRPPRPYPNYIWVDGNYYWRGGRYVHRPGYWAAPRPHRVWAPGVWIRTPRGYYWRRGHWR
ncbi:hypothetical protein FC093_13745 [Ilyomonas limi]|uniref:YXWGXW repeat-containing protein n=1 Tax=Ilyomonas limi TaxID=2575867 RepID=A0A4U3L2L9_9BACT|nr:YXWGXW repeat-containing protein [Ilyomonas limi]TKK67806.1 hypothetical protein FC093_13745 [Ilyomonas limi]